MGARLQGHVHRRPAWVLAPSPAILQRRPLGMKPTQLGVEAFPDNLPVPHEDRTDQRIRTHPPASALRKLQSSPQLSSIGVFERSGHLD